ncbi:flagellar basal body-associated protein FliL [Betaproteobacteria bacterium SCN1]|jgi:flagellar FliL protein|nr:flagellar basal body-associated protein FliL [Betaproteobacteria bacterium SCN1]MBN8761488.1 flagellar basal body-associated protein FliL [Thiobacillus sp.]ODU89146.1 MAG: flagellar basal body-associated protein FliL [Thiobacillus sp. SCN 65-179]OJW34458.1 MAG: flagellar basal body-associated protein FliL [Thiobacillus sp. 65-69]
MSKAEEAAPAEAAPKKSKKLLFIIIGLVILLAGGGAGAWFMLKPGHDAHAEKKEEPPKTPIFMPLETFTVNLMGSEQYLQTDITLQLYDQAQVDLLKLHMPRIRSRLLTLLSSQSADQLQTEADKKRLAQAIQAAVNEPVDPKGKPQTVNDVLFTSFVIQ